MSDMEFGIFTFLLLCAFVLVMFVFTRIVVNNEQNEDEYMSKHSDLEIQQQITSIFDAKRRK
jgi:hypothetical protein